MPKFRFNLEDGQFLAGRGEQECDDAVLASEVADDIADHLVQLQPELLGKGCAIVVRDQQGAVVYRAMLDDVKSKRGRLNQPD